MIWALIAFVIAVLALGVMGWIVMGHWADIRLLDPMSIKEERQKVERGKVMNRRFERASADQLASIQRLGRTVFKKAQTSYRKAYQRLNAMDRVYRKVKSPFSAMAPSNREKITAFLSEARSLMRDLKWADAERRFLEVLSIDRRNLDAYKGLGQIYLKQKLYPQARETFEFLVKTKQADDASYAGLAEIAEAEGNPSLAEGMRLKAVAASPRQAFRHAELAQFYLAHGKASQAWEPAKRASDLEPGSAKYLELSLEIAILLGDRNEAKARWNRLRMLSDDPSRFQALKDKVDAL